MAEPVTTSAVVVGGAAATKATAASSVSSTAAGAGGAGSMHGGAISPSTTPAFGLKSQAGPLNTTAAPADAAVDGGATQRVLSCKGESPATPGHARPSPADFDFDNIGEHWFKRNDHGNRLHLPEVEPQSPGDRALRRPDTLETPREATATQRARQHTPPATASETGAPANPGPQPEARAMTSPSQAADGSSAAPQPEGRAQSEPATQGLDRPAPDAAQRSTTIRDLGERVLAESRERARREMDRIDPGSRTNPDLWDRYQRLSPQQKQVMDDFSMREHLREKRAQQDQVGLYADGGVRTAWQEERRQSRLQTEAQLRAYGAMTASPLATLGGTIGRVVGNDDPAVVEQWANQFDSLPVGNRGAPKQHTVPAPQAHNPKPGNQRLSTARRQKNSRSPSKSPPTVRPLSQEAVRRTGLDPADEPFVRRAAQIYAEEMAKVAPGSDLSQASLEASNRAVRRLDKEFPQLGGVVYDPPTGASNRGGPGHQGDALVMHPDGTFRIMLEYKRTAFLRQNGEIVTKGMDAKTPGQADQTVALEAFAESTGTPTFVINRNGVIHGYDPDAGSWFKAN